MSKIDKRFNRIVTEHGHWYMNNTGDRLPRTQSYSGFIKCKLIHGQGYSLVVPDVLVLDAGDMGFIQPLFFMPNMLVRDSDRIDCGVFIDISCGQTIGVRFDAAAFVRRYEDGSELYRCAIDGPEELESYVTGACIWGPDDRLLVRLFHHTSEEAKESIIASRRFRLSSWNIQGTKRLANVGYVYFTCIPEMVYDNDLRQIAMASDGKLQRIIDRAPVPTVIAPGDMERLRERILELVVYRESTPNRRSTIELDVDAGFLAPSHFLRHRTDQGAVYYEFVCPYIYRMGLTPGSEWEFDTSTQRGSYSNPKSFDYVVVGDAGSVRGLAAPFDEEETEEIATIDRVSGGSTILEHWFEHANTERFDGDQVERQEFSP